MWCSSRPRPMMLTPSLGLAVAMRSYGMTLVSQLSVSQGIAGYLFLGPSRWMGSEGRALGHVGQPQDAMLFGSGTCSLAY